MNFDIFNGRMKAEERVAALQEQGYEAIDLSTLVHHWAAMNSEVPATIQTLETYTAFARRLPKSGVVIRETVLDKALSAMRNIYDDADVQVVKKTGQVLWKHGEVKKQGWEYFS